jgi:glycosyltransferase involved in cell wall biosynthesis
MISETIDSVIASELKDFDILVFDNCSTDGTVDLLKRKYCSSITIISHKENIGMNGNVNFIFDMMRSTKDYKYFITLHDDNLISSDFLSKTIELLEQDNNIAFAGTAYRIIDNEGKEVNKFKYSKIHESVIMSDIEYYSHRCEGFWFPWSGAIIRTNKLGDLRFLEKEHPYYADIMFFTYLAEHNKIAYVPEYLFHYRTHENSATDTLEYDVIYQELLKEIEFFSDFLKSHKFDELQINKYKSSKNVDILYFKVKRAKNKKDLLRTAYWFVFENPHFKLHQLRFFPYRVFKNKLLI